MNIRSFLGLIAACVMLLSGCAVIETARNVGAVYEASRTYANVKELAGAVPALYGAEAVRVETEIAPRDEEAAEVIEAAFVENMDYLVAETVAAAGLDAPLCGAECPEMTLLIQFIETGFDGSFAERVTMGARLRGDLYLIDARDGSVLERVDIQSSEQYVGLSRSIQAALGLRALNSRRYQLEELVEAGELSEDEAGERMAGYVEDLNVVEPVRADLREILESS